VSGGVTTWRRRAGRATSITVALALATTIGTGHGSARGAGRGVGSDSAAPGFATTTLELASQDAEALGHATTRALAHGGDLVATGPGVALVELAPTAWPAVAAVAGVELRRPVPVDIRPERTLVPEFGPVTAESIAITGADAWHTAGIDGNGVRIGVIDFFDTRYWDPAEHGPLPQAGVNARCFAEGADCTADFFDGEDLGGEDHGVAVVEIIRDMAPGAEILLGQAETLADYELLVDWFVSQGVRVISRSLGSRYDGPGDGRGALNEVASRAVSRGITWINSGGNNAVGQYYRHAVRLIGSRVAFGPAGTETYLPLRGCIALGGMRWANDWDRPPAERTDYDLYVWESPTGSPASGEVIGISQRRQTDGATPIEVVAGTYCPPAGRTLYLEVRWLGGDVTGDVLEILDYGNGFTQHTQAEYSAAVSIVDADVAGVVSVGAIDPPDSGTIGIYSSRGPTNDGRVAPQVTAPSGVSSTVYDGRFSGTSAAAPVVAGAAALFLDAELAGDAASLGDLVRHSTVDRGDPGPDNTYGHGELRLPAPPPPVTQTPSRYVPLAAPTRALDTRPASPVGPAALIGPTRAGEIRPLPIAGTAGVPVTATSVAVNIVTVAPDRRSFVQALPLWQSTLGGYSNLNTDGAAQNRANFAIVPIAADGTIALYSTAAGHLVVDVLGWFEPVDGAVTAGRFVALPSAQRLLDTRDGGAAPVPSGTTLAVPDPTGIVTDEIEALVVTVTAVRPSSVGWLQAFPAARPDVVGTTSTVNTAPGSNAASTAIVPIAPAGEGVAVHTSFAGGGTGHVVVDAIGYFTSATAASSTAGRYVPLRPVRAFDSRLSGGPLLDGQTVVVDATGADVPIDARGVMWNLTVVNATRQGYATGWAASASQPATSSLNWSLPGEVRAAAAVTAVSDGAARFRLDDQGAPEPGPLGHLLVDVFGYFT
jgi:hypothetical protein